MFSLKLLEKNTIGMETMMFYFYLSLTMFVGKSPHLKRKHEERKIRLTLEIQKQVLNVSLFFIITPKKVNFYPDSGQFF
jgi:hypothetical protein